MTVNERADSSYEYLIGSGDVHKLWQCPKCKREFLFGFNSKESRPSLDLKCPSCGQESPIPWPTPPMIAWTCRLCGHVQMASRQNFESYTEVSLEGKTYQAELRCNRCFRPASDEHGVLDDIDDLVGGLTDGIRQLFGWETASAQQAEYHKENREKAKRAKRAFDNFLKQVPKLRAEQAKLAEEEKQRAALEAKARQEELRLLKRQARTAIGLKRMKPTNFELAVASLYLKLGYEVYGTPTSSDRGIDLVAIKNKERIAVQCKRYKRTVPVSQVRDFYGSFVGTYNQGVFVTSSAFSQATREWAEERQELELLNGQQLAKLFVEHDPKIVRNVKKWKEHTGGKE